MNKTQVNVVDLFHTRIFMRIGLAQINSFLGDFSGNRKKILQFTHKALKSKCDLIIFPEMSLFGYHPMDLLERESIVNEQVKEFQSLVKEIPANIGILLGLVIKNPQKRGKPYFNSAAFLLKGQKPLFFSKSLLPTEDVFDEMRHFSFQSSLKKILLFKNKKILITICEDIWVWPEKNRRNPHPNNPFQPLKKEKIDFIVNLSASPFAEEKVHRRIYMVKKTSQFFKKPMVYVNMVGAQDEIIFDGGSFVWDHNQKLIKQSPFFKENLDFIDLPLQEKFPQSSSPSPDDMLKEALVLGIRDFVFKTGFKNIHLGLSGGIDSAVVATLAQEALGSEFVTGIALPGPFNSPESLELAYELSQNLGISFKTIPIDEIYQNLLKVLSPALDLEEFSLVHENLQARIRGLILMTYSNKNKSLLLSTSNKSEYSAGYATLYGDMCGALSPIGDLIKKRVYDLAHLYNKKNAIIPEKILTRAPSAELRPNQKDQDTLPPYEALDQSVYRLVENFSPAQNATDRWLLKQIMQFEFKRWQAPPILKISEHAFGVGRRFPIAHKAYY